jgi:formimidoylglutamate deiminase
MAGADAPSTGRSLFEAAIAGGHHALGVHRAGLAMGEWADLVTLNAAHPTLVGRNGDAILDSWIFASRSSLVDCVWSRGRKIVSGGVHDDRERITTRFQAALNRLLA